MIDTTKIQSLIKKASIPAISYACVTPTETQADAFSIETISLGIRSTLPEDIQNSDTNAVDTNTLFPASSLSKIVFAYLVLKLCEHGELNLDQPLHDILPYERFIAIDGEYPEQAKRLTARHILTHTTGLPNWAPDFYQNPDTAELKFDPESTLGSGYYYSGEAFLYLQKVIEKKMGKDLETLAKEYVFSPIGMTQSSYKLDNPDAINIVKVHTEFGSPETISQPKPEQNSACSLVTTASDYAKFMIAWLSQTSEFFSIQAFSRPNTDDTLACGLGWHIYNDIAWQYGANRNTRSFVAINIKDKSGIVFFTNSENGMSIVNQILTNVNGTPVIGDMRQVLSALHYRQSDEAGWEETIKGCIAEKEGNFDEARTYYEAAKNAVEANGQSNSKEHRRLAWFNAANNPETRSEFKTSLEEFAGRYAKGEEVSIEEGNLIIKISNTDYELVRISDTEFVPKIDQIFKIKFADGNMNILLLDGYESSNIEKISDLSLPDRPVTLLREAIEEKQDGSSDALKTDIDNDEKLASPIISPVKLT